MLLTSGEASCHARFLEIESYMQKRLLLAVLMLLTCSSVQAQAITDRPARSPSSGKGQPSYGGATIVLEKTGRVQMWIPIPQDLEVVDFISGVSRVGSYEVLDSSGSLSGLLIAGSDAVGGRLEVWRPSGGPGIWAEDSSVSMPLRDLAGVAFDGSRLYILDYLSETVLWADWDGVSSLGALTFLTYATTAEVSELEDVKWRHIMDVDPGSVPGFPVSGIMLVDPFQFGLTQSGVLMRDLVVGTPNPIAANRCYVSYFQSPEGAVTDELSAYHGGTVIAVHASPGHVFEVRNELGALIGSGIGANDGSPIQVSLSESLVMGQAYMVRGVQSQLEAEFVCLRRRGFPEPFADGSQLSRIHLNANEYQVGNAGFSMTAYVDRPLVEGVVGPRRDFLGGCLLALGGTPIVPFDNGNGLNELLITEFWVGALGFIGQGAMSGYVSMQFPLTDPALEGLELMGQFVVFDDGGVFRLSEVVGFKVQPSGQ